MRRGEYPPSFAQAVPSGEYSMADDVLLEQEREKLYTALGRAITQWQGVEEGVSLLFSSLVVRESDQSAVANAAFHSILNFESKLGMIHSAINMHFFGWPLTHGQEPCEPLEEWRPLHNRAIRRAKRRNELAHFALTLDEKRKPGQRYYLSPNIINLRSWMLSAGKPPERDIKWIVVAGNCFEKLGNDLTFFCLKWFPINQSLR